MRGILKLVCAAALASLLGACAAVDSKPVPDGDVRQKIAEAYGIQAFGQIARIRFEFNLEQDGKQTVRKWVWEPKTDRVAYQGLASQLNPTFYSRKKLDADPSGRFRRIDEWFANDVFWLLFPFHLAWDGGASVEAAGRQALPMGWGRALKVLVSYPPENGHPPGDVFELYVDENYRLVEWTYRRAGEDAQARVCTWEDQRPVGPITIAMAHKAKEGDFRLWFSDVAVQLEGSEEWIAAK